MDPPNLIDAEDSTDTAQGCHLTNRSVARGGGDTIAYRRVYNHAQAMKIG